MDAAKINLYEDPEFKAEAATLAKAQRNSSNPLVVWKRPGEIRPEPILYKEKISDVDQGALGDCWFLASLAALCKSTKALEKIIPSGQHLYGESYTGAVSFNFYSGGKPKSVKIDDRLPINALTLTYLYGHSKDVNEFWCALVEKAFAKFKGKSYQAISGNTVAEALMDLTGGSVARSPLFLSTPGGDFYKMKKSLKAGSFVCAVSPSYETFKHYNANSDVPTWLVLTHAYTVTKVDTDENGVGYVTIRNPWGATPTEKNSKGEATKFDYSHEGFLTIPLNTFSLSFQELNICRFGSDDCGALSDKWNHAHLHGSWAGSSAAGWFDNEDDRARNPQYYFHIMENDMESEEEEQDVHISLIQEHRRSDDWEHLPIGFHVYKLESAPPGKLNVSFFKSNRPIISVEHEEKRILYADAKLSPGHYLAVPSTMHSSQDGEFWLRVFTEIGKSELTLLEQCNKDEYGNLGGKNLISRLRQYFM